jgi:hypothetical protein
MLSYLRRGLGLPDPWHARKPVDLTPIRLPIRKSPSDTSNSENFRTCSIIIPDDLAAPQDVLFVLAKNCTPPFPVASFLRLDARDRARDAVLAEWLARLNHDSTKLNCPTNSHSVHVNVEPPHHLPPQRGQHPVHPESIVSTELCASKNIRSEFTESLHQKSREILRFRANGDGTRD